MSNILFGAIPITNVAVPRATIEETPSGIIRVPVDQGRVEVDDNVVKALPTPSSTLVDTQRCGWSLWGRTAKLTARLPQGTYENYFLEIVPDLGDTGRNMCKGEFESLKAIDAVSSGFVPKPYAWGDVGNSRTYFFLVEFRDMEAQPAEPAKLAARLADLHRRSVSPTGKFGFHVPTVHAKIVQAVDRWDDSWCVVFSRHLGHITNLASRVLRWPEFDLVARLTIDRVVPRLLLPLQSDGRVLKPSLIHGDCWDGNTAIDAGTGEALIFDVCSFHGHNEYDTGNWRAPRHALSDEAYIREYKRHFPVSEPDGLPTSFEDWDARNRLYSLPYNIGNAIYVPNSSQRQVVCDDITTLCKIFCPEDLRREMEILKERTAAEDNAGAASSAAEVKKANAFSRSESEEEEEEEEDGERSGDFNGYDVIWGRWDGQKRAAVAPRLVTLPAENC